MHWDKIHCKRDSEVSLELEKLDTNGDENDMLQLPRICMNKEFYFYHDMPLTMKRLQFPIKLSFAVTFHIIAVNYGNMSATCLPTRQMSSYLGRQAKCHDTEASLSAK